MTKRISAETLRLLLVLLLFVLSFFLKAQPGPSWRSVGTAGFSSGNADYTAIAVSRTDSTVYVAFKDVANGNKVTVMQCTGGAWSVLGSAGINAGAADHIAIATYNNKPIVAFKDYSYGGRLSIMRWSGSAWNYEGTAGAQSAGAVGDVSITATGMIDIFYVAYTDQSLGNKVMVKKKSSTAGAFTDITAGAGISAAGAHFVEIASADIARPYVVYTDSSVGNKATVRYYNNSSWSTPGGTAGITPAAAAHCDIAVDMAGLPVVVYRDANASNKASVMKWNGTTWAQVGAAGFTPGTADFNSIDIDADNRPVVAFRDGANSSKLSVRTFNGSAWVALGTAGISSGGAEFVSMVSAGGYGPFVVYKDAGASGKIVVSTYGCTLPSTPVVLPANPSFCAGNPVILSTSGQTNTTMRWYQVLDSTRMDSVGASRFVSGINASSVDIEVGKTGDIFIAVVHLYDLLVYKRTGNTWTLLGNAPANTSVGQFDMAIDPITNQPYVATVQAIPTKPLDFFRFNGSAWVALASLNEGNVNEVEIKFNNGGILYETHAFLWGNGSRYVSLNRYTGTGWENLVQPANASSKTATNTSLAFTNDGAPVVAHVGGGVHFSTILTQDNSGLADWATKTITTGGALKPEIIINEMNEVFIAYREATAQSGRLVVVKKNGIAADTSNGWTVLGGGPVSVGTSEWHDIKIDNDGTLYVVYADAGLGSQAQLKKWTGSAWVTAGVANFSAGAATDVKLAFDANNQALVIYVDAGLQGRATLLLPEKKFLATSTQRPVNMAGNYFVTAVAGCKTNVLSNMVAVTQTSTTNTWTGAVSTFWTDAANWGCGRVPNSNDDVIVPAGIPNNFFPIVTAGTTGNTKALTIMPGAKITINSTGTLVVTKELILLGNARIDNKTGGVVQVTAGGN